MTKITTLTAEQQSKFAEYVRTWTDHGVSTEPADRPRAEVAIRTIYEIGGKKPPGKIVWCDSPLSMALVRLVFEKGLPASAWASVRASVGASWLSFYRFFRDECGLIAETEKLRGLWELCESCGWILPFENICFASERHDVCRLDERGLIHSADGPAVHYRDGFAVHAWHGVHIPPEWVEPPGHLTAEMAVTWENVEQRRAACEILGWAKILTALNARTIDADGDPEIGTLLEVDLPGDDEEKSITARFVQVRCGTGREFALCVPPETPTAIAAQAWMLGLTPQEFTKPEVRT
jgi:hypothetical protein